jgi:serine/threonine protein kinase
MRTVGRYELLGELGRGGMATVYLARQTDLGRLVALKELTSGSEADPSFGQRFERESRLIATLSHPNIVTVHDYFEHEGQPFIAMEYVTQGTLRPHVRSMSLAQTAGVLEGLLAGLAHAETHGIVHRDLKPENVMLTADGRVKIADFGIAKVAGSATHAGLLTATGMTVGTPLYMAPEQAMGKDVGPWTDLYSLGAIAYEMLCGQPPISGGDSLVAILLRVVNETPAPLRALVPSLDPALSDWVAKLLDKAPERRTQSANEAWDELEDIVIGVLGPRWRKEARLQPAHESPNAPRPLTPAPFESSVIRTPERIAVADGDAYVTFERGVPPAPAPADPPVAEPAAAAAPPAPPAAGPAAAREPAAPPAIEPAAAPERAVGPPAPARDPAAARDAAAARDPAAAPDPAAAALVSAYIAPGEVIDGFEILEVVAVGGSSTTFRATHQALAREVAFKFVHPGVFAGDDAGFDAARADAIRVARLEHPAIAPVFAAGRHRDGLYVASALPKGRTLEELAAGRAIAPADVAPVLVNIGDALAEAHAQGVVHRDLRPACITVDRWGHGVLRDFGVTRASGRTGLLTRVQILDSLRYTAPEVVLGRPASPASDVFALAAVAVCCLTGLPPYRDRPPGEYVVARTTAPPPALLRPDGSPATEVNAVLAAAMASDPDDRPAPAAFAAALSEALAALPAELRDAVTPLRGQS